MEILILVSCVILAASWLIIRRDRRGDEGLTLGILGLYSAPPNRELYAKTHEECPRCKVLVRGAHGPCGPRIEIVTKAREVRS